MDKKKNLELTRKLAVLGWIYRHGYISNEEYQQAKTFIMKEYETVALI